jgi:hypothetical protein
MPGRSGICAVLLVAACSGSSGPAAPREVVIRQPLGLGEVAQSDREARTGHEKVRLLSAQANVPAVTGSHAEFVPKRPLYRVRVRVTSNDARLHTFLTGEQRLVVDGGALVPPSFDAMRVKRQPEAVELGARDAMELDLWFEPPVGARPTAVRLVGDHDPDPQGVSVSVAGPPYVDLPLRL